MEVEIRTGNAEFERVFAGVSADSVVIGRAFDAVHVGAF